MVRYAAILIVDCCPMVTALVEGMDYHVQLSVDSVKLKNVTIHTTGFSQRSWKMMMNKD